MVDDELVKSLKAFLEKGESLSSSSSSVSSASLNGDALPVAFLTILIMREVHLRAVEPGRLVCSMKNGDNCFHLGAVGMLVDLVGAMVVYTVGAPSSGVSLEINISSFDSAYLDEEIEIDAKALRVGKAVAVVSVELRKKYTGKLIAYGRHTMYPGAKVSRL